MSFYLKVKLEEQERLLSPRPYQRGSWAEMSHGGSIVTVNAFYSPNSNTMIGPIGMLQVLLAV